MKNRRSTIAAVMKWSVLVGTVGMAAGACSSRSDQPQSASGGQGGNAGSTAGHGGSASGTTSTAGEGGEAGSSGPVAGAPVSFTVPAGGGQVAVALASGDQVGFDFPASAAGRDITLTPTTAQSIGWGDRFDDVIRMEPDGMTFPDPIVITPSNKDVLVFDFPSSGARSGAAGLALASDGQGLLLNHFSTLVVVPAGVSCDSTSGWNASPNDSACANFGMDSTLISFGCKAYAYCLFIDAKCCAPPGSTACEFGMSNLTLTYVPNNGNGMYPYCASGTGGSGGGGGQGGSGAGGRGGTSGGGQGGSSGSGGASGSTGTSGSSGASGSAGSSGSGGASGSAGTSGSGGASGMSGASGSGGVANLTCGARTTEATLPVGTGQCVNPFQINPTPGVLVTHYAATGGNDWSATSSGSSCVTNPVRTDVYEVLPPAGWTQLDVTSSSSTSGEDTKISVVQKQSCASTEELCANAGGPDACELLSVYPANVANLKFITVVVSSNSASSTVQTTFLLH